jgi:hypothetical protein
MQFQVPTLFRLVFLLEKMAHLLLSSQSKGHPTVPGIPCTTPSMSTLFRLVFCSCNVRLTATAFSLVILHAPCLKKKIGPIVYKIGTLFRLFAIRMLCFWFFSFRSQYSGGAWVIMRMNILPKSVRASSVFSLADD